MNKEIGNDDGGGIRIPGYRYWILNIWYMICGESGRAAGPLNWIEYGLRTHWNEYCTDTLEIGMTKVGRWFVQRVIRDQVEYAWYGTCEVCLIRSTNWRRVVKETLYLKHITHTDLFILFVITLFTDIIGTLELTVVIDHEGFNTLLSHKLTPL